MSFTPDYVQTAPESGSPLVNTQRQFQDLKKLIPTNDQPLLLPFDINNLAAGTIVTFTTDSGVPDLWIVAVRPAAGVRISVFNGPQGSGVPYRLGGGGKLKLPATSEYLTILIEAGSGAAFGTVVAERKYPGFDIDPGDLA